jgi:hypothetical protein
MPKWTVYKDARVTYRWHEEIEAESEGEALEIVDARVEALLDSGVDPYGREADHAPFFEVDWDGDWYAALTADSHT